MWGTSSHFTAGWTLLLLGVPPHPAPSQAQFPNLEVGGSPRLPASPGISGDRAGPDQGDSVARARVPRGARTRVLALQPPHGPIPMASLQGGRGAAAAGGGARPAQSGEGPSRKRGQRGRRLGKKKELQGSKGCRKGLRDQSRVRWKGATGTDEEPSSLHGHRVLGSLLQAQCHLILSALP